MNKFLKYGSFALFLLVFFVFFLKGRFIYQPFDSERWKNWQETESEMSLRWDMMNDLRKTHNLNGKTTEEIIELLGEPASKTENPFSYYLGMAKSGIDIGVLSITFDESGRVSKFIVRKS